MTTAVALVTGAGRGLGSALARRPAADGMAVAVNDLVASEGTDALITEIRAAGGTAAPAMGDVTERSAPVLRQEPDPAGIPLERFGTPAEVAAVVSFLASDAASFVTGERIAVNGGHVIG